MPGGGPGRVIGGANVPFIGYRRGGKTEFFGASASQDAVDPTKVNVELLPNGAGYTPEADGGLHVYVRLTGNDANDGKTPATAVRTVQRAIDIMNRDLVYAPFDIVIEGGNGDFAENVDLTLISPPLRRVIMRGDLATLPVTAAGTTTAGTGSDVLVDATAAFGAGVEQVGKIIEVTIAGVPQYQMIGDQTATSLRPNESFFPAPGVGDTYRILDPSAPGAFRIVGAPADPTIGPLRIRLPWTTGPNDNATDVFPDGPNLTLAFMSVIHPVGKPFATPVQSNGGSIRAMGFMIDGPAGASGGGWNGFTGKLTLAAPFDTDPIFGIGSFDFSFFGLSLGIRILPTFAAGLRMDEGGFSGLPVVLSPGGIFGQRSCFIFTGGVSFGEIRLDTYGEMFGGSATTVPLLVAASATLNGLRATRRSFMEVTGPLELRSIAGDAVLCDEDSFVDIQASVGAVVISGTGIGGDGAHALNAGRIQVGVGVAITPVAGTEVVAGSATGTFGTLTPAAPVIDRPPATPGSGATVWRA